MARLHHHVHGLGTEREAAVKQLLQGARKLSPYLMVEMLLPGGTLIALLLWLYRHHYKSQ